MPAGNHMYDLLNLPLQSPAVLGPVAAILLLALVLGFAAGWLARRPALQAAARRLDEAAAGLAEAQAERAALRATLEAERAAHGSRLEELAQLRRQIEGELQQAVARLLESGTDRLGRAAQALFAAQQEKGEAGLKGLVEPMRLALERFHQQVAQMEAQRKKDEGALVEQLRQVSETHRRLHTTTAGLVNALRSAPKTRGRWGEQQLRTLLEMAGMAEHVDFETEKHVATDEGRFRPDVVIRMPGGRCLVVDAKTSLSAYLAAVEAESDEEREAQLKEHARQVRVHAMQLGAKEYWRQLPRDSVDFVVMFVPGEPMYAAAMARDPDLFEDAWDRRVIICSPTTLLGLAKAVAYGWRQEMASRDARQVHELGVELYRRMVKLGGAVAELSRSLESHVRRHNAFIGSLEGHVLPKARQMTELSIGDAHGAVPELEPVALEVRAPRPGRDLHLSPPEAGAEAGAVDTGR